MIRMSPLIIGFTRKLALSFYVPLVASKTQPTVIRKITFRCKGALNTFRIWVVTVFVLSVLIQLQLEAFHLYLVYDDRTILRFTIG